ncbi:MAG: exodeoxyribonuclease VII large subunit, partial [Acidobacteriota bacterium]
MSAPPRPAGEDRRRIWSVGELLVEVKQGLETGFPWVWVRGEISDLTRHTSGHWYFSLKDDVGVLQVAMFRSANVAVPFRPEEGLEVTAGGRLTLYERRGRFQLIAETLEPVGWGAMQLAFEQLTERLAEEGLFARERKRALPLLPRCVGVVTSRSGAAWRDMTRVWERREVGLRVLLAPARVQGDGAAEEIAAGIDRLVRHGAPEVLIVGRGGGSREELWAFNEEAVARAIAASPIPVIAAVGHEIDTTIADLVADERAATPTAAAEIVAPARVELTDRLDGLLRRARRGLDERLHRSRA